MRRVGKRMNWLEIMMLRVRLYFEHKVRYDSNTFYTEIRSRNRSKFITDMTKCMTNPNPTFAEVEHAFEVSKQIYSDLKLQGLTDAYGNVPIVIDVDNKRIM